MLEEGAPSQPESTPPPAAPAATPAPAAPSTPAVPETRRETIAREMAKPQQPRGQHAQHQPRTDVGQFAGPPKFPTPSSGAAPSGESAVPQTTARPAMPKSLKLELQPHWDTAPLELATAIHQRELDYEKGVTPLKEKARQADELLAEFKPYEQMLAQERATPKQAVGELLRTAAILRTGSPAQKAQAVASTMRQFGISLQDVHSILSGNAPPQPALDPQYNQLAQQVNQLTQLQQQQNEARALAAIKRFSADPKHKHFDAVSERILGFLEHPQTLGLDAAASEEEKLEAAYDAACRLDPEISAKVLAEQQAAELAARQAQNAAVVTQARQAAVQVKGAPSAGPPLKVDPKNRRAIIANQVNAAR